ncbi:hypothetical protein E4U43_003907 [Claviceps pusilla]|uniref:Subtilisin-like serine protease n=1 Tax=Claviceps pusilla TaxID=123648 RepID=A0A9P7SX87_9HYPO|nr:hypothetical protein E4U43_003907 [Claviceps pusilla]
MVRSTLITSVLAAAYAVVAAAGTLPGGYIIELEDGHDHAAVLDHLKDDAAIRMHLDSKPFRGLSFQLHDLDDAGSKAKAVGDLQAVKAIWPIRTHETASRKKFQVLAQPQGNLVVRDNAADTFSTHVMTQVDQLRAKNITGAGIKVAVIDGGIDYTHPALGKCYGKGCLVSFGHDFVGDAYDGSNTPVPGNDPKDCNGHGTHVAGILAAQENPLGFTGVAPGVTLGAYRIMGCSGYTADDLILAALNKAFEDGAQIITSSIVQALGWNESPWAVAASRIADKGVPCVIAAGNDGNAGLFYLGNGASGKGVTAVASFDNSVVPLISYHSSYSVNGEDGDDFLYTPGDAAAWDTVQEVYATSKDAQVADDACKPLPDSTPDLSKFTVLVRRGGCDFAAKLANIAAKGGQNVMFYNNEAGTITVTLDDPTVVKSTGMVSADTGAAWVKLLQRGFKVVLSVTSPVRGKPVVTNVANNITGGAVSAFSSWGPTWDMDLKPEVGAPGANILSTYPVAKGGYSVQDGTSMSAPMVAGIMALIGQVRGTLDPKLLNSLLSTTAKPQNFNDGTNFFAEYAPAAQQGGGMVQAYKAAYTTTLLSPPGLSFNDSDHLAANLNFTVTNKGSCDVTYEFGQIAALTMYTMNKDANGTTPFPNEAVNAQAVLTFSQNKITLPAGHSATIGVTAKPPTAGLDLKRLPFWSGYIMVAGSDKTVLSLPYQGISGSLHQATVLQPDQTWVYPSDGENFPAVPQNYVFTLPRPGTATDKDVLCNIYANLAMGSRMFRVYVLPVKDGVAPADAKPIGQVLGSSLALNDKGWTSFTWFGKLEGGSYAPAGKYQFKTQALRLYGDASKPEDWDTAYTQVINIEYRK